MKTIPCQVCGKFTISAHGSNEICPVCFWEDDGVYTNPDEVWDGPNKELSLTQARENYREFGAASTEVKAHVRLPESSELPENNPRQIKIDEWGRIVVSLRPEELDWYAKVKPTGGGYYIFTLERLKGEGQGADDWVENRESVDGYFEESNWVVDWLGPEVHAEHEPR